MRHQCQNCDKIWQDSEINEHISNLRERVSTGELMPSGECPECGALCHWYIDNGTDCSALHPLSEEACQIIDAEFFTGDAMEDLSDPRFDRLHYMVVKRWYPAIQNAIRLAQEHSEMGS